MAITWKIEKYHTGRTVPKYNVRGKIDTLTHRHITAHFSDLVQTLQ
jgi:hypothetical protein